MAPDAKNKRLAAEDHGQKTRKLFSKLKTLDEEMILQKFK